MKELCFSPVTELSSRIREGVLSPVELVETFLERIRRLNPKVNAYCLVLEEEARKRAEEAERALKEGKKLGPLHGIPIAIKDLTPMHGVRTTFGSRLFENFVPIEGRRGSGKIEKGWGHSLGKDQHSRVRLDGKYGECPLWGHPQSLEFGKNGWRIQWWIGGCRGCRNGPLRGGK
ncbi:MAG: hypothetical protein DSO02_01800 [Hadesarchaea archaeon]|nr:MAG: hypothetical protein DSO02_01800 [Hadesarchaea archaeon]